MKKIYLIISFLIVYSFANAQSVTQKISPQFTFDKYSGIMPLYGLQNNKIYAARIDKDFYIDTFTPDLKSYKSHKLTLDPEDLKLRRLKTLIINTKIYDIVSGYDKKLKSRIIYGKITGETGSNTNWKKLIEVKDVHEFDINLEFSTEISPDSNNILILKYTKGEKTIFPTAYVFNMALDQTFEKEFKELEYDYFDIVIDNNINFHFIGGDGSRIMQFYTYYKKENQLVKNEINTGDNFLSGIKHRFNSNNGVFAISGFYHNGKTRDMDGLVYITIDPSTKKVSMITRKFSNELLLKYLPQKKVDNGDGLANFEILNFKVFDNGDVVAVCEIGSYIVDRLGKYDYENIHYWEFNDLVVVKFNPEEDKSSFIIVPKSQASSKTLADYSSHLIKFKYYEKFSSACIISQNSVDLIYNDVPENLVSVDKKRKSMGRKDKSAVCLTRVDLKSGTTRLTEIPCSIPGTKSGEFAVIPAVSYEISSEEILILTSSGDDKYNLVSFRIPKN